MKLLTLIGAAALLAASTATPRTQATPPEPARKPSWPKLDSQQQERIAQLFKNLSSNSVDLRSGAETELAAIGAGAAPLMIAHLSDHDINVNDALLRVLPQVTSVEHAPLLAQQISSRRLAIRRFVVRRLAELHPADMGPVFRAVLRDRDAEVVFLAQLGITGTGDFEFMGAVFERCSEDWNGWRALVAQALSGARGEKGTRWLLERMAKGSARDQVTALRLLRTLGLREATGPIAVYLEHENHNVKKEAINALRAIVDGEPPLEELSVFQAIEMAKQWKARL